MCPLIDLPYKVLLPYRFTLFSNYEFTENYNGQFYYLIDLHYSQTGTGNNTTESMFYYLIDLHYSQT